VRFVVGQLVLVPCRVERCSIPDEALVTIEVSGERMSGFVRDEFLDGSAVRAVVRATDGESVTLALPGAFFLRATDRATIPRSWAATHLRRS
jgi:hypothetical protein